MLDPSDEKFGFIPWPGGAAARAMARPHDKVRDLTINQYVALQSMASRAALQGMLGQTFRGKRDIYQACGYAGDGEIAYADYRKRYDRGGIAGRIVDIPAEYTWRNPPRVLDGSRDPSQSTPFQQAWSKLAKRLRVWSMFERLDRVSGIGQFAVIFIGTKASVDQLREPIGELSGPEDILYLSVFAEDAVTIKEFGTDVGDERMNLPTMYQINMSRPFQGARAGGRSLAQGGMDGTLLDTMPQKTVKGAPGTKGAGDPGTVLVHWSRIIHFADNLVDDDVYGMPRMQRPWNYLDDLDKIVGGSAETFWQAMRRILQFNVDKDVDLDTSDEESLLKQMEALKHGLDSNFRTRGTKIEAIGGDVTNPRAVFSVLSSLVVGTTGIPLRILFGPERGQFAVGEERTGWLEVIKDRQEGVAEPRILRQAIDRFIDCKALPEPAAGGTGGSEASTAGAVNNIGSQMAGRNDDSMYLCSWPDLLSSSDGAKADVAVKIAEAVEKIAHQEKDGGRIVISPDEFRQRFAGMAPKAHAGLPPDDLNKPSPSAQAAFDQQAQQAEAAAAQKEAAAAKAGGKKPNGSAGDAKPAAAQQ